MCYSSHCNAFLRPHCSKSTTRLIHVDGTRYFSRKSSPDSSTDKIKTDEKFVDESKLSLLQRFKLMYKQYWYVLLPVHCITSAVWYGAFFIAAKNGVDIVPLLKIFGVTSETILGHLSDSNAGYYAISYAMYKVATPARYTATLGCTTFSINYLKNRGHIKPVPSKKEIQEMYVEKRDEMLEKRGEILEKIVERREEMRGKRNEFRGKMEVRRKEMQRKRDNFRGKLEERKGELLEKLEDQKTEMTRQLEERRYELRQRLTNPAEIREKWEDKKGKIYVKIDANMEKLDEMKKQFGVSSELQQNLEDKAKSFQAKLEETKDIVRNNISNHDDISKLKKKY